MAHRYDRRVHDQGREEMVQKQIHWHQQLNKDLMKAGMSPQGMMNDAINKAYQNDLIGERTVMKAHDIRVAGNVAKHKF